MNQEYLELHNLVLVVLMLVLPAAAVIMVEVLLLGEAALVVQVTLEIVY